MEIKQGKGTTKYGPGISIDLTGEDVATAGVYVSGPRTITVNDDLCDEGQVYVDPSGFVIQDGKKINGRWVDNMGLSYKTAEELNDWYVIGRQMFENDEGITDDYRDRLSGVEFHALCQGWNDAEEDLEDLEPDDAEEDDEEREGEIEEGELKFILQENIDLKDEIFHLRGIIEKMEPLVELKDLIDMYETALKEYEEHRKYKSKK